MQYTDSEGSTNGDHSSPAGTPVKKRPPGVGVTANADKQQSCEVSDQCLSESPTNSPSNKSSKRQGVSPPCTPKKHKGNAGKGKSPCKSKSPRKSPLLALEESLKCGPKKGTNAKNKKTGQRRQTASISAEEERQTAALEDMVRVVKGAVNVHHKQSNQSPKPEPSARERWLSVTGDRMELMDPEVCCTNIFNKLVNV